MSALRSHWVDRRGKAGDVTDDSMKYSQTEAVSYED
jgi:hypothetical protein